MQNEEKTDLEILKGSYRKYKDKKGRKAVALKSKIERLEFWENIWRSLFNKEK